MGLRRSSGGHARRGLGVSRLAVALVTVAMLLPSAVVSGPAAAAPPQGFETEPVADVPAPTDLAFLPDGRLLIASQGGKLYLVPAGATGVEEVLDLGRQICTDGERGLLGVAVDPDFDANGSIYLYYTASRSGGCPEGEVELKPKPNRADLKRCGRIEVAKRKRKCRDAARDSEADYVNPATLPVNRVARFTMDGNGVGPAPVEVLLDNMVSLRGNHNGGDLGFGKDGNLYVSVGDSGCQLATREARCSGQNRNAQYPHVLNGKLLRVDRNGDAPSGNAFGPGNSVACAKIGRARPGQNCAEIYASGLRNPFRIAFDPDSDRIFINDVGGQASEEIDSAESGANYGWPFCEGRFVQGTRDRECPDAAGFTDPVYDYRHTRGGSITGGAFVPDDAPGNWQQRTDDYIFGDYVYEQLFEIVPGSTASDIPPAFDAAAGPVSAMTFNPDGDALYYGTYANKIFRVVSE